MIQFSLPYPPSANNLFPGKARRFPSKAYKAWRAAAGPMVPAGHIDGPYTLRICLERPDRRARDLGNLEKAISDLLKEEGLIADDRFMNRLEMWWSERTPAKGAVAHVWISPIARAA